MAATPLGFPYPGDSDYDTGADVPRAVQELADALDDFLTGTYKLVSIRYVTSGVTFEPTADVDALYVECVGAGGGGGGCTTGATNSAAGGGGGGGGYAAKWITVMKHPFTVAIGVGGLGATASNGGTGSDTSFDSPSVCTGLGGTGGIQKTVAAPPTMGGQGGTGGSSDAGDFRISGTPGLSGFMLAAAQNGPGNGGGSHFGGGAVGIVNLQGNGSTPGTGYGGGGSGGGILSGGASVKGGDGRQGVIRVWEFRGATSGGA